MNKVLPLLFVFGCFAVAQDNGQDRLRNIMTTKGDVITSTGHAPTLMPRCTDGQSWERDSAQANAWKCVSTTPSATAIAGGTAGQYAVQSATGVTAFKTPNVAGGPAQLDSSGILALPNINGIIYAVAYLGSSSTLGVAEANAACPYASCKVILPCGSFNPTQPIPLKSKFEYEGCGGGSYISYGTVIANSSTDVFVSANTGASLDGVTIHSLFAKTTSGNAHHVFNLDGAGVSGLDLHHVDMSVGNASASVFRYHGASFIGNKIHDFHLWYGAATVVPTIDIVGTVNAYNLIEKGVLNSSGDVATGTYAMHSEQTGGACFPLNVFRDIIFEQAGGGALRILSMCDVLIENVGTNLDLSAATPVNPLLYLGQSSTGGAPGTNGVTIIANNGSVCYGTNQASPDLYIDSAGSKAINVMAINARFCWVSASAPNTGVTLIGPRAWITNASNVVRNFAITSIPVTATPGDLVCAYHSDTSVNTLTVTAATNAAPIVFTVAANPISAGYYIGSPVSAKSSNPSAYDGVYHVVALDSTHITVDNGGAPGATWTSGTILYTPCTNSTDAITASPQPFSGTISLPANTLVSGRGVNIKSSWQAYGVATIPLLSKVLLYFGSTMVSRNVDNLVFPGIGAGQFGWSMTGGNANALVNTVPTAGLVASTNAHPVLSNIVQPMSLATTADGTVSVYVGWAATGMGTPVYVSGGAFAGDGICTLDTFNGAAGSGATANISVAGGVAGAITITNTGTAYTGASTTAALHSGTATCSGTATITTVLGGAQGNAMRQLSLSASAQ